MVIPTSSWSSLSLLSLPLSSQHQSNLPPEEEEVDVPQRSVSLPSEQSPAAPSTDQLNLNNQASSPREEQYEHTLERMRNEILLLRHTER